MVPRPDDLERPPHPTSRRQLLLALRVVVSFGLMAYLAASFDWAHLRELADRIRPGFVLLAPPLVAMSFAWGGLRWSFLLGRFGIPLRWRDGFLLYLIGGFYNILLPGTIGGDVVRIGLCASRHRRSVPEIAATTLIERVAGLLAALLIGLASSLLLAGAWRERLGPVVDLTLPMLAGSALAVAVGGWAGLRLVPVSWFRGQIRGPALRVLARIAGHVRELSAGTVLLTLLLSLLCQLPAYVAAFLLGKAVGIELPPLVYGVIMPLVVVSTVLPISLGGLGVREGVLTFLLAYVGIGTSDAIALAFLVYLANVVTALGGGIAQVVWQPGRARPGELAPAASLVSR